MGGASLYEEALDLLRALTGSPAAQFHEGQFEAIEDLVTRRRRVLVVQRTGWGKSAVYFIATKLLRARGAGPTLLVSPLLALMRNQIVAAERMGVAARSINSTNDGDWSAIEAELEEERVDLLLISPERLANRRFRERAFDAFGPRAGLLVVDEAHCISDWGHDFRADYRRINRILDVLPPTVPVLACTATANERVIDDLVVQLGGDLTVRRGPLGRDGLALEVIDLPTPQERMAWLAEVLPQLPGTGIVYCLTVADAGIVASWLQDNGIDAACYTGGSKDDERQALEARLLGDEVKVVVATSALGMGFDKPNLTFVIHFQAPGSPITYYQQVGRAGRQLEASVGVLLRGNEDRSIQDWFIDTAFPSVKEAQAVIEILEATDGFVARRDVEDRVNIRPSRLTLLLKNLEVDGAIVADGWTYARTATAWAYDHQRVLAITELRRREQAQMVEYGVAEQCRMAFLRNVLDDPESPRCGLCDRCAGPRLPTAANTELTRRAEDFTRKHPVTIEPRIQSVPKAERLEPGRALCRWLDAGWGSLVQSGKQVDRHFADELVAALRRLVRDDWRPDPAPTWVTFVPSTREPALVADLAERLGTALGLPVHAVVQKVRDTEPQKTMKNGAQQRRNVHGAFVVAREIPDGPVLLVDDIVDSRWTLNEIGSLLRVAGCPAVLPVALAEARAS